MKREAAPVGKQGTLVARARRREGKRSERGFGVEDRGQTGSAASAGSNAGKRGKLAVRKRFKGKKARKKEGLDHRLEKKEGKATNAAEGGKEIIHAGKKHRGRKKIRRNRRNDQTIKSQSW